MYDFSNQNLPIVNKTLVGVKNLYEVAIVGKWLNIKESSGHVCFT